MYVRTAMGTRGRVSVLALALAMAGCGSSDNGAGSGGQTQRLHATQTKLTKIFRSKQGFRPGDAFITTSAIAGGGHKEAYCVVSSHEQTDWCSITIVRPQGQVTAQGAFLNAPKLSGAVALLSGSGAYAGASGTLTTSGLIDRRESITLRLR